MKPEEVKKLIISSLDAESSAENIPGQLENAGVSYDFRYGFSNRVLAKLSSTSQAVSREVDFVKNLSFVFYRIALTGIAAILILMISIYFMEGSFSLNSILGIGNNYDESIICMLTGK